MTSEQSKSMGTDRQGARMLDAIASIASRMKEREGQAFINTMGILDQVEKEGMLIHDSPRCEGLPIDAGTHQGITPEELDLPPEVAEEARQSQQYWEELMEDIHTPTDEEEEKLSRMVRDGA
jgi:hypothetical protein